MKKLLLILLFSISFSASKAQSAEDIGYKIIFQILEQIGEIKYYASILEQGYHMVSNGLHIIGDIKNGEFILHNAFFDSLKSVKPEIRNMTAVGEIIFLDAQLIKRSKDAINGVKKDNNLHADEVTYIINVFNLVISNCNKDLEALINYTTSGKTSMNDGERILLIQGLNSQVKQRYSIVSSCIADVTKLRYSRSKSRYMNESILKLYGLQ
jgi:hypothetical protein